MSNVSVFSKLTSPPSMGDDVIRIGKIFDIGRVFDDKGGFCLTLDEARNAVKEFKPCNYNVEHKFSNMPPVTGRLEAINVSDDGKILIGVHKIPKWYDRALDGKPDTFVSCEFNKETKLLEGIGFTSDPAVEDAALFNKENTLPDGILGKLAAFFSNKDNVDALTKELEKNAEFSKPAEEYVNKLIEDKKLSPKDKDETVSLIAQSMQDDKANPVESFSRVDSLKKQLELNKVSDFTGEKAPDAKFNNLDTGSNELTELYNSVAATFNKKGKI